MTSKSLLRQTPWTSILTNRREKKTLNRKTQLQKQKTYIFQ